MVLQRSTMAAVQRINVQNCTFMRVQYDILKCGKNQRKFAFTGSCAIISVFSSACVLVSFHNFCFQFPSTKITLNQVTTN